MMNSQKETHQINHLNISRYSSLNRIDDDVFQHYVLASSFYLYLYLSAW